ncbi:MAG: Uma2 family endonuclease [Pirellulales bacterium]|nr:Uma2 family endonuclease [Pirellulales bacterium]
MATAEHAHIELRVVLHGVPWATYLALRDVPESRNIRMTYDRGELEMMAPTKRHENYAHVLGRLIEAWSEELDIDIQSCRAMTCRREDLERGFEPDNSYYVKNEPLVWQKLELDLSVDPPPDLAIEVDLSTDSFKKMPLCAVFGVPEVWRYDGRTLEVFELGPERQYLPRTSSPSFPRLPLLEVQRLLGQVGLVRENALVRSFRTWIRENVAK